MIRLPYKPRTPYAPIKDDSYFSDEEKHEYVLRHLSDIKSPKEMKQISAIPVEWFKSIVGEVEYESIYTFGAHGPTILNMLDVIAKETQASVRSSVKDFPLDLIMATNEHVGKDSKKYLDYVDVLIASIDQRTWWERVRNVSPRGFRQRVAQNSYSPDYLVNVLPQLKEEYRIIADIEKILPILAVFIIAITVKDRVDVFGSPLTKKIYNYVLKPLTDLTGSIEDKPVIVV